MKVKFKINELTLEGLLLSVGNSRRVKGILYYEKIPSKEKLPESPIIIVKKEPNISDLEYIDKASMFIYEKVPILSHISILLREFEIWGIRLSNIDLLREYDKKYVVIEVKDIRLKQSIKSRRPIMMIRFIPPLEKPYYIREALKFKNFVKDKFGIDITVIGRPEGLYVPEEDIEKFECIDVNKIIEVYTEYNVLDKEEQIMLSLLAPLFFDILIKKFWDKYGEDLFKVKSLGIPLWLHDNVPSSYVRVRGLKLPKDNSYKVIRRPKRYSDNENIVKNLVSLLMYSYEKKDWIMFGKSIVTLSENYPDFIVGFKFFNLSILYQNKIPVPEAVCLTTKCFDYYQKHKDLPEAVKKTLENFVGDKLVAVRSSGVFEDLPGRSFAGIYKTILGVKRENLFDAIKEVYNSAFSERVIKYFGKPTKMAVIVQYLIPCEKFAVVFTRNPVDKSNNIVIESTLGLGEPLVSGKVTPETIILNRKGEIIYRSNARINEILTVDKDKVIRKKINYEGKVLNDKEVEKIYKITLKIEGIFGRSQDIELGIYKGKIWVFQSRNITTL